jgi:hypothetical protein
MKKSKVLTVAAGVFDEPPDYIDPVTVSVRRQNPDGTIVLRAYHGSGRLLGLGLLMQLRLLERIDGQV